MELCHDALDTPLLLPREGRDGSAGSLTGLKRFTDGTEAAAPFAEVERVALPLRNVGVIPHRKRWAGSHYSLAKSWAGGQNKGALGVECATSCVASPNRLELDIRAEPQRALLCKLVQAYQRLATDISPVKPEYLQSMPRATILKVCLASDIMSQLP